MLVHSYHAVLHCQQLSLIPPNILIFFHLTARARYSPWAASTVGTLEGVRAALWPAVQPLGTVYTEGAFYFLVPVPAQVRLEVQDSSVMCWKCASVECSEN
jgi:hypothetical protein